MDCFPKQARNKKRKLQKKKIPDFSRTSGQNFLAKIISISGKFHAPNITQLFNNMLKINNCPIIIVFT